MLSLHYYYVKRLTIWFLNLVLNLEQRGWSIVNHTREGDSLKTRYRKKFWDLLRHQFVAGWDNKGKLDLVQDYLVTNMGPIITIKAK